MSAFPDRPWGSWASSPGAITREEVRLYDPPPGWSAENQADHERIWSKYRHIPNQSVEQRNKAKVKRFSDLPSAEAWQEYFAGQRVQFK